MYKFEHIKSENSEISPEKSLFLFLGVFFFGLIFGNLLASFVVLYPSSGFDTARFEAMISDLNTTCLDIFLCHALQAAFMLVTFFIVPVLYLQFFEKKDFSYLSHKKAWNVDSWKFFALGFALIFLVYPISLKLREYTILGMDTGFFGSFGNYMKLYEEKQELMIESMIDVKSLKEMLSLLLVISVIPALGEELVFRGILQNILLRFRFWSHPFLPIFITAILFSALHFNLSDFVPRVLLGFVLGLSYNYSKNIWVPIVLHFANNALSVWYYLSLQKGNIATDIEAPDAINWVFVLFSSCLFLVVWIYFQRTSKKVFLK